MDAAAQVFAAEGLETSTMTAVAEAAGLQSGSLYFHFESKDRIVEEVLRLGVSEALTHLSYSIDLQRDLEAPAAARLIAAIEAHLVALHELSDYATVILAGLARRSRRSGDAVLPHERRYAAVWLEVVREAQEAGALDPGIDPRLVRDLLIAAMNGTPLSDRDPEQVARGLATLIGLSSYT